VPVDENTVVSNSKVPAVSASMVEEKRLPPPEEMKKQQQEKNEQIAPPVESNQTVIWNVSPSVVDVSEKITVEWEMKSGQTTAYDWIGLFAVDKPNKQYYTYQWKGKNDTNKGTLTFTAPTIFGEYEFRYFANGAYQHAAMSQRVKVGPQVDMKATIDKSRMVVRWAQLSGNKYPRAWIGLYEKNQTNNKQYLHWEYALHPEIAFEAPVKPQEYEFRFFTNSYDDIARSNVISIEGADSISASIENGVIYVKPNILTVDPYYDSAWVGLYFTSQNDNRQWRRYKYLTDRRSEVQFKAPKTAGEYEARLFASKTLNVIAKSSPFVVGDAKKQ